MTKYKTCRISCYVDRSSPYNREKKNQLVAQIILSIFRQPLHVSGVSRLIIRRYKHMCTTIGTYYSFWMTVCCPGWISWRNIPRITFNNCTLYPHCICVFCVYLRTNSDLCHLQHKLIGFYNPDEKCLQRGTDWVFQSRNLHFVFKMLMFIIILFFHLRIRPSSGLFRFANQNSTWICLLLHTWPMLLPSYSPLFHYQKNLTVEERVRIQ